ncbi:hypothetical protein LCGC14_0808160 [marine sediment metagenome]|uniref:Uncharacterized protein n=1 Tax=marine sediment metagenome TaxID=412755 RepID=A0A0F9PMH1_9ZZZZ
MANIFRIDRPNNTIALGTTGTITDIGFKHTAGSQASPIDVTNTRQHGFEIHYSGNNYNVTAIRARAQLVTTDTSASAQGALLQAVNNDGINAGVLNGALIEAIGKSTTTAATITMMRGCLINTEWSAKDTVTDLRVLHVRTHTRDAATEGYVSGTGYGIYIENEAVGGNGQALDAGIYFKGTNLSAGNKAYTYGVDFSGATYGTADIKLSNNGVINNISGQTGLGTPSPDGTLHVHTASAGSVTAIAAADDLIIENNDNAGISILTPNNKIGGIYFGDPDSSIRGQILYGHAADTFTIVSNQGVALFIDSNRNFTLGSSGTPQSRLTVEGTITLTEQAAAESSSATYGQVWTKTATPNELWFTDDTSVDRMLSTATHYVTDASIFHHGDSTNYTKITATGDIHPVGSAFLVFEKASGNGIKVDQATPTFGFADLLGDQFSRNTGGTKPTLTTYNGDVDAWQFSDGDEAYLTYHIPHDYVPGTDIHLHIHWSQNNTGATGGTIDFKYFAVYAKGHNQASGSVFTGFSGNPITATFSSIDINDAGSGLNQYQQHITEITISGASATSALFDRDDFEPDGVIELTLEMDANNLTGTPSDPFIHYADIHYQTTGLIGTKSRTPDFYA